MAPAPGDRFQALDSKEPFMFTSHHLRLPRGITLAVAALRRTGLAVVGFFMLIGIVLFTMVFGALLLTWALLSRRLRAPRSNQASMRTPQTFRTATRGQRRGRGEVLDVESREIPTLRQP